MRAVTTDVDLRRLDYWGGKKKKEDPLLPAPGKCRGRTRLENSPSERIMIVKSGGAGHEAGRGERVAHKRIIKRPA